MKKASYVDDTPVPVLVLDCDHNIEYLNRAAALLGGTTPEACIGLKMWDVFDNEACRNGSCLGVRAMREGHTLSGSAELMVKGRKLPVRAHASPRYDDQNKVIGFVQVLADNSEEARFEAEISRLVQASLDGQLSQRGKPEDFQDRYRDLMTGVNAMLDAILLPIGEGNRILAQISDGKIDELIAQTYKGDHEKMKQAVNNVAVVLQGLQKELASLNRRIQRGTTLRTGQAGAVQGCLCRHRWRRQPDARRHPAAHRRRQPHPGADFQRQDRRVDRANLQGRPREDEAGRQQRGLGPAGSAAKK